MDVLLLLETRNALTGEWREDGMRHFEDDGVWRGHVRARRTGEHWVAEAPGDRRCAVLPMPAAA